LSDGALADQYARHLTPLVEVASSTVVVYEVYKWVKRERSEEDALTVLAVAGAERVEAWVLYEQAATPIDIWGAGGADPARSKPLLALLLRALAARAGLPLRLPRLGLGELPEDLPATLGFTPGAEYTRWAARARAL